MKHESQPTNDRTESRAWYRTPGCIVTAVLLLASIGYLFLNLNLKEQKMAELDSLKKQIGETSQLYVDLHKKTREIAFAMEPLRNRVKDAGESLEFAQKTLQDSKNKLEEIKKEPLVIEYLQKKDQLINLREGNKTLEATLNNGVKEYKEFQRTAYQ